MGARQEVRVGAAMERPRPGPRFPDGVLALRGHGLIRDNRSAYDRTTARNRPFRRELARRSERYFKSGHGRKTLDRLMEAERRGGCCVMDAEKEGLLANPFGPTLNLDCVES